MAMAVSDDDIERKIQEWNLEVVML